MPSQTSKYLEALLLLLESIECSIEKDALWIWLSASSNCPVYAEVLMNPRNFIIRLVSI